MSYQSMVEYLRRWHILAGYGWPGKAKGAAAVSRYPNIAAELQAGGWLETLAEFARVSPAIMAAVIEDGEELSRMELERLACRLGRECGYLGDTTLTLVDPDTNRGKARRRTLRDGLCRFGGLLGKWDARQARAVLGDLEAGQAVTYARWRRAMDDLGEAAEHEARRRSGVRTERRAAG